MNDLIELRKLTNSMFSYFIVRKNQPSVCNKQIASIMAFKAETFSCGSIGYLCTFWLSDDQNDKYNKQ